MKIKPHKSRFGNLRSPGGQVTKPLSFSLYPKHIETLRQRERELNVSRSIIVQILLELERSDGLIRQELISRLTKNNKPGLLCPKTP